MDLGRTDTRRVVNFDVLACPLCGAMATAVLHGGDEVDRRGEDEGALRMIPNAVAAFRSNGAFIPAKALRWENDHNLYASFVRQAATHDLAKQSKRGRVPAPLRSCMAQSPTVTQVPQGLVLRSPAHNPR
jgi:hypothetical protein